MKRLTHMDFMKIAVELNRRNYHLFCKEELLQSVRDCEIEYEYSIEHKTPSFVMIELCGNLTDYPIDEYMDNYEMQQILNDFLDYEI